MNDAILSSSPRTIRFTRLLHNRIMLTLLLGCILASSSQAQVKVGSSTSAGTIEVRSTGSANELIFEVGNNGLAEADVAIGRGGANAIDTDFLVFDPQHSTATKSVLHFDATTGQLTLGSGSMAEAAEAGDLVLLTSSGEQAMEVNASGGNLYLGSSGGDGDITLRDSNNVDTIFLSANSAALTLGGGRDGDLYVRDSSADDNFSVSGSTGTATNDLDGEGLVKAWCQVDTDGSLIAGYRCTSSRTALGTYDVDFTAVGTDIRTRPFLVSCSGPGFGSPVCDGVAGRHASGDFSAIQVFTRPAASDAGPFTIVLF